MGMKIQIDAKVFEEMVAAAAQAISSKPMKPENECVYVEVNSDSGSPIMTVLAKDSGLAIRKATDNIRSEEDGNALIPAKTLLSFLKLMKGEVTMTVDAGFKATLKCGRKRSSIQCMDASEYNNDFTDIANAKTAVMDGAVFQALTNSVTHCIGADQGRMILTGINFAFDAESGVCEATGLDGFRMSVTRKKAETNESFSALIPGASAKLIAKTIAESENVDFRFGNGVVIVDDYTTSIEASLLSGEYIDYKKLMVKNGKMEVKINIDDMADAVKTAMVSAADSGEKKLIVLNFDHDGMARVFARSDKSEAISDVPCETIGHMEWEHNEIAFNGDYIMDAIKAASVYCGEVKLMFNTATSPMAMTPVDRDDYYQLVLPVRRM